jgi:hypothetical protein
MWWYNWRYLPHMKDEALAPNPNVMESCPIVKPLDETRTGIESAVSRLIAITRSQFATVRDVLDWLGVEHEIQKPSRRLQAVIELDSDALVAEVKKLRGKKKPLSLAALRNLREEHEQTVIPAQALAREAQELEKKVSDLVNAAYGLTPEEVRLMWESAPPRMPIARPLA